MYTQGRSILIGSVFNSSLYHKLTSLKPPTTVKNKLSCDMHTHQTHRDIVKIVVSLKKNEINTRKTKTHHVNV